MKLRRMKHTPAMLALALLPTLALAAPPSTKLQPGLWQFHNPRWTWLGARSRP